jgi:hypothetical protein
VHQEHWPCLVRQMTEYTQSLPAECVWCVGAPAKVCRVGRPLWEDPRRALGFAGNPWPPELFPGLATFLQWMHRKSLCRPRERDRYL